MFYNLIFDWLIVQAKAETLCVCWDKLDADVTELTAALTSGGGSKITMDRLEKSISTLKSLFIERQETIEELAPTNSEKEIWTSVTQIKILVLD